MSESVLNQALWSHPAHPPPAGVALSVARLPVDDPARPLHFRFVVQGDPAAIRWPAALPAGEAGRTDGLWRHTCFEVFVAAQSGRHGSTGAGTEPSAAQAYVEFNFAPSGAWAAYRFDAYRAGMRPEPLPLPPRIVVSRAPDATRIEVACAWPRPRPGAPAEARTAGPVRLGLTAVLEASDGSLSYWALRHPDGRPDFHNDAGFQLEVEVPG